MKKRSTAVLMSLCFGLAGALGLAAVFVTLEDTLRPGHQVTRHIDRSLQAGGRPVRVEGQLAHLAVVAGPGDLVSLSADVTAWLPDRDDGDAGAQETVPPEIEVLESDDLITIRHRPTERHVAGFLTISLDRDDVDLRLTVPRGTSVEIDNSYGEISVRGVAGPLSVRSASCGIEIQDAAGPVRVENSYGDVTLAHILGEVTVSNTSGGITAGDIEGSARLETRYGQIEVKRLVGSLEASSGSGGVTASGISGDVTARCSYGSVQAEEIGGRLEIDGTSVDVDARRVASDADISTSYGRIALDGAGGAVRLRNQSGPVEVRGLFGAALTAEHRVETSYSSVTFGWPRGRAVSYDLESSYGTIASDLPGLTREEGPRDALSGSVGEGPARITIVSNNGDIRLLEE